MGVKNGYKKVDNMMRDMRKRGFELDKVEDVIQNFLQYYYGMDLDIPVEFSRKLKKRWGTFKFKQYKRNLFVNGVCYNKGDIVEGSMKIVINDMLVYAENQELVDKIIKHEAVHYALYRKGLPFKDGDLYFEREIKRLGLVNSKISQEDLGIHIPYWVWECENCGEDVIVRKGKTRINHGDKVSNCCNASIKEVGWKYR